MASPVESRACLCFSVANSLSRVRLINVARTGLGNAFKTLCGAMNSTLSF
ncbi:hypothetical protein T11_16955 [Trichinella zimbabwensis]|uniref:Uncharacterized protein n=1 Tax=Trichinella zimbabwensis TaxID=268475 RepID=A0A0V1GAG3_9BILA|nr:hypothetical protein T11_16955 [Trichinella zimbabwensis]